MNLPEVLSSLSGTEQYKMLFPAEGLIHQRGYAIEGDYFEGFLLSIANESGTNSQIKVNYYSSKTMEETNIHTQQSADRQYYTTFKSKDL